MNKGKADLSSLRRSPRSRGFTLIEVLAALVIVALGMLGVIEAVTQSARNGAYLREKTLAHWIAPERDHRTSACSRSRRPRGRIVGPTSSSQASAGAGAMQVTQTQVSSLRRMDVVRASGGRTRLLGARDGDRLLRSLRSVPRRGQPAQLERCRNARRRGRGRERRRVGRWWQHRQGPQAPASRANPANPECLRPDPSPEPPARRAGGGGMMPRRRSGGSAGFTLLELLVSVAIFAVVGTLALKRLYAAAEAERVRGTAARSNARGPDRHADAHAGPRSRPSRGQYGNPSVSQLLPAVLSGDSVDYKLRVDARRVEQHGRAARGRRCNASDTGWTRTACGATTGPCSTIRSRLSRRAASCWAESWSDLPLHGRESKLGRALAHGRR